MTKNSKTRHAGRVCHCVELCAFCNCKTITPPPKRQVTPHMGSELRALMSRYAADLLPLAENTGERVVTSMIECCNFLIIEAERLEGGQP
jgi:hypothetical protein